MGMPNSGDRRIVRVNVEVVYNDGTFEELKVQDTECRRAFLRGPSFERLATEAARTDTFLGVPGNGGLALRKRS